MTHISASPKLESGETGGTETGLTGEAHSSTAHSSRCKSFSSRLETRLSLSDIASLYEREIVLANRTCVAATLARRCGHASGECAILSVLIAEGRGDAEVCGVARLEKYIVFISGVASQNRKL